jgi:hypothetical protein
MKIVNKVLELNKTDLLEVLKNNPDKSSVEIDRKLIVMILNYYGRFTIKQQTWILEKVKYIFRYNKKYLNLRSFKDIILI